MPRKPKPAATNSTANNDCEDFSNMKVAELRKKCEKEGLESKGTKAQLIQRLTDNVENESEDWESMKVADLRKACEKKGLETGGTKATLVKRLHQGLSDGEPPAKLSKQESENTKIRRVLNEGTKKSNSPRKAKVDKSFPFPSAQVLDDYDCMLNLTNITGGRNNNKYYIIQVLKVNQIFYSWTRWGRVGEPGKSQQKVFPNNKDGAIEEFEKKFHDKTKNQWSNRDKFKAVPGKYTLLEMTDEDEEDEVDTPVKSKPIKSSGLYLPCSLDPATQKFIKLIFDENMFNDAMKGLELDTKKMPLGKLSKSQIAKGFEALIDIENEVKGKRNINKLQEYTSRFYTLIPHDFGRVRPPVIDSEDLVQKKKDMLLVLSDIEMAQTMQKEDKATENKEKQPHPLDVKYKTLGCGMKLIETKSKEYDIITNYIKATGPGHLKLLDAWEIDRSLEDKRFKVHDNLDNRKLLWHGTNVAVVAAIMKTGLRIMPHSGGRVGRGIYFASENSKSAAYVRPTGCWGSTVQNPEDKNIGVMFLAEVALGKENHISRDNGSLTAAPKGYDCVIARGQQEPDPKYDKKLRLDKKDVVVPQGKPVKQPNFSSSYFWQSEYLVYKESQVRLRYMLKLKFGVSKGW